MKHSYLWLLLLIPNFALADAGIGIFYLTELWQVIALFFVIIIEYFYLSKKLSNLRKSIVVRNTIIANIISTILGILLSVVTTYCVYDFTYKWRNEYRRWFDIVEDMFVLQDGSFRHLPVFFGLITIFLICFLISWISEYLVFYYMQKKIYTKKEIFHAVLVANVGSYIAIFLVPYLLMVAIPALFHFLFI